MSTPFDSIFAAAAELAAANFETQPDSLPFPAMLIQVDSSGGNFLIPADRLAEVMAAADIKTVPPGFTAGVVKLGGNKTNAFTTSFLDLAVIGRRSCWESENGRQLPISLRYELLPADAGRWVSRTHLLALLLGRDGDAWQPWAPVVVTARSTQSGKVREAIRAFDTQTRAARRELVGTPASIPVEAFALPLGFGKDIRVGKVQTSTIAPVIFAPDASAVTADWLRGRLLTSAILATCIDLRREADAWLHAWDADALQGAAPTNGNGGHDAEGIDDDPLPASAPQRQAVTAGAYGHGL